VRAYIDTPTVAQFVAKQHWLDDALKSHRRSAGLFLTTHGLSEAVVVEKSFAGHSRLGLSEAFRDDPDAIGFVMSSASVENT
jgi:hypothetical protein